MPGAEFQSFIDIPTIPIGAFSPLTGARPFRRAPHSGYLALFYQPVQVDRLFDRDLRRGGAMTVISFRQGLWPDLLRRIAISTGRTRNSTSEVAIRSTTLSVSTAISKRAEPAPCRRRSGYPALPFTFRSGIRITLEGESWETEITKTASDSSTQARGVSRSSDHAFFLSILGFLLVALAGVLVLLWGWGATKIGVREVVTLAAHGAWVGEHGFRDSFESAFLVCSRQFWWGLRSLWLAFCFKGSSETPWRIHT